MEKKEKNYQELFAELSKYERAGISMEIDGTPASPLQIVSAHMIREEECYMRDYIAEPGGKIKKVNFHHLDN